MENILDLTRWRLVNQCISNPYSDQPHQVLSWLGAIQAQDYPSAKWAIGLRSPDSTDSNIEQAIHGNTVLRTWLNRGTLHFVAAQDVRWMLKLLATRNIASSKPRYRQLELDEETFSRSWKILSQAMKGRQRLSRKEAMLALERAGVSTAGQRGYHILGRAAQEGLICIGPVIDKDQTFFLLEEWIPPVKEMGREESLTEIAMCYFQSHGPATLKDFIWWSGLPASEARQALDLTKPRLTQENFSGQVFWLTQNDLPDLDSTPSLYLLPAFDEYFLGYADRSMVLDPKYDQTVVTSNGIFRPVIILDGQVIGTWKRQIKKGRLALTPYPFDPLSDRMMEALSAATQKYANFLKLPLLV